MRLLTDKLVERSIDFRFVPKTSPKQSVVRMGLFLIAMVVSIVVVVGDVVKPPAASYASPVECPTDEIPVCVFRFDERPPEQIFKEGFKPFGQNDNLIAHVAMDSVGKDSAWVSTSSDPLKASMFGAGRSGWIYRIWPDENVHSVNTALNHAIAEGPAQVQDWAKRVLPMVDYADEWSALNGVPGGNIIDAIRRDPFAPNVQDWSNAQLNPDRVKPSSRPSGKPFPLPIDQWLALDPCTLGAISGPSARRAGPAAAPEGATCDVLAPQKKIKDGLEELRFVISDQAENIDPKKFAEIDPKALLAPLPETNKLLGSLQGAGEAGFKNLTDSLRGAIGSDLKELNAASTDPKLLDGVLKGGNGANKVLQHVLPYLGLAMAGMGLVTAVQEGDEAEIAFAAVLMALEAIEMLIPQAGPLIEPLVLLIEIFHELLRESESWSKPMPQYLRAEAKATFLQWEQLGAQLSELRLAESQKIVDQAIHKVAQEKLVPMMRERMHADQVVLDKLRDVYEREMNINALRANKGMTSGQAWANINTERVSAIREVYSAFDRASLERREVYVDLLRAEFDAAAQNTVRDWSTAQESYEKFSSQFDDLVARPAIVSVEEKLFAFSEYEDSPIDYSVISRDQLIQERYSAYTLTFSRIEAMHPLNVPVMSRAEARYALAADHEKLVTAPLPNGDYIVADSLAAAEENQWFKAAITISPTNAVLLPSQGRFNQRMRLTWNDAGACYTISTHTKPDKASPRVWLYGSQEGTGVSVRNSADQAACWTLAPVEGGYSLSIGNKTLTHDRETSTDTVGRLGMQQFESPGAVWQITAVSEPLIKDGWYSMAPSTMRDRALDTHESVARTGAVVTVRRFSPSQEWKFTWVESRQAYLITSGWSARRVLGGVSSNGDYYYAELMDPDASAQNQYWYVAPADGGTYRITNAAWNGEYVLVGDFNGAGMRKPTQGQHAEEAWSLNSTYAHDLRAGSHTIASWIPGEVPHYGQDISQMMRLVADGIPENFKFTWDGSRQAYQITASDGSALSFRDNLTYPKFVENKHEDTQYWRVHPASDGQTWVIRNYRYDLRVLTVRTAQNAGREMHQAIQTLGRPDPKQLIHVGTHESTYPPVRPWLEQLTTPSLKAAQSGAATIKIWNDRRVPSPTGTAFEVKAPSGTSLEKCLTWAWSYREGEEELCGDLSDAGKTLTVNAPDFYLPAGNAEGRGWYEITVTLKANSPLSQRGEVCDGQLSFTGGNAISLDVKTALCFTTFSPPATPRFNQAMVPELEKGRSGAAILELTNTHELATPIGTEFKVNAPSGTTLDKCLTWSNSSNEQGELCGDLSNAGKSLTVNAPDFYLPGSDPQGGLGWQKLTATLKADSPLTVSGEVCDGQLTFTGGNAINLDAKTRLCLKAISVPPKQAVESVDLAPNKITVHLHEAPFLGANRYIVRLNGKYVCESYAGARFYGAGTTRDELAELACKLSTAANPGDTVTIELAVGKPGTTSTNSVVLTEHKYGIALSRSEVSVTEGSVPANGRYLHTITIKIRDSAGNLVTPFEPPTITQERWYLRLTDLTEESTGIYTLKVAALLLEPPDNLWASVSVDGNVIGTVYPKFHRAVPDPERSTIVLAPELGGNGYTVDVQLRDEQGAWADTTQLPSLTVLSGTESTGYIYWERRGSGEYRAHITSANPDTFRARVDIEGKPFGPELRIR